MGPILTDHPNSATKYPHPFKIQGIFPHVVPRAGYPSRLFPPMIDAIKASRQSPIQVIAYESGPLDFVCDYGLEQFNLLVYLVNLCDIHTQNVVLSKIHPHEVAKMSQEKSVDLNFERLPHWPKPRKESFFYWLTQYAGFFLLFEYFRSKYRLGHANLRPNDFVAIVQAARSNEALPQPQYSFGVMKYFSRFRESEYVTLRAALISVLTENRTEMAEKAEAFIEFIKKDPILKDDEFSQQFLSCVTPGRKFEIKNNTNFSITKF